MVGITAKWSVFDYSAWGVDSVKEIAIKLTSSNRAVIDHDFLQPFDLDSLKRRIEGWTVRIVLFGDG